MSRYIHIAALALIILFASCKKEEFPVSTTSNTSPVFYASGSIDGEDLAFNAGLDNFILKTDISETYSGNYILSSLFESADCVNCGPSLKISLTTNTGEYHNQLFYDDMIAEGILPYFRNENSSIHRSINLSNLLISSEINSTVVNGYFIQNNAPDIGFNSPIVMDYIYTDNGMDIDNDHYFTMNTNCDSRKIQNIDVFGLQTSIDNQLTLQRPNFDLEGSYTWNISWEESGEVISFTQENASEEFMFTLNPEVDFYNIALLFAGDNDELFIQRQNHIPPGVAIQIPLLPMEVLNVLDSNTPTARIEYKDGNGNTYVSSSDCIAGFHQNMIYDFFIEGVQDFGKNPEGHKTKQINFTTSLDLVNQDDPEDIISLSDFTGSIGMPLPN